MHYPMESFSDRFWVVFVLPCLIQMPADSPMGLGLLVHVFIALLASWSMCLLVYWLHTNKPGNQ